MNPLYLILAILILIVILYFIFYVKATPVIIKTVDLNQDPTKIPSIQPSNKNFMPNGESGSTNIQNVRYTYSVWIFVNNLGVKNKDQTLFTFGNSDLSKKYFRLYLDSTDTAQLNVDILFTNNKIIPINNSFPLQKWTNIIVSVDTNFVDIYQDGKLSFSSAINKPQGDKIVVPDTNSGIFFGSSAVTPDIPLKQDITLGNIMRWPNPIDPDTAYSVYLQGNGQPSAGGFSLQLWSRSSDYSPKNLLYG